MDQHWDSLDRSVVLPLPPHPEAVDGQSSAFGSVVDQPVTLRKRICSYWYHSGSCNRNPESFTRGGKPCPHLHTTNGVGDGAKLSYYPIYLHRQACRLELCPRKDLKYDKAEAKKRKQAAKGDATAVSSIRSSQPASRKRKRNSHTATPPTSAKRPATSMIEEKKKPFRSIRHRDDAPKRSAKPAHLLYDEPEANEDPKSPLAGHTTCFFWYHGQCARFDHVGCDYLHALTEPLSMVQPPPGYTHKAPCALSWCPGDGIPKGSKSSKARVFEGVEKAKARTKRSKGVLNTHAEVPEAEDDGLRDDTSEAPSCGQEVERNKADWYLEGFEEA
ncbi:hypothetical protein B0A50_02347 [Salinomyces thailandicus]|uniref:C3H1-type domain-containing protein n=1 Tax=Salinomyces thailandicus TaxID=706561 RepID=A0A4U0U6N5_9PEZI|nr:hypothetical protein B0A50_02347 [Salinomyces thailandica]